MKEKQKLLLEPFEPSEVNWRIQHGGSKDGEKAWLLVVPYITGRAVDTRLDEVFGFDGWEVKYKQQVGADGKFYYLAGITFHTEKGVFTKWDGSDESSYEKFKGSLSGAKKRAAAVLGIGRYLYRMEPFFVDAKIVHSRRCPDGFRVDQIKINKTEVLKTEVLVQWRHPQLPDWALPRIKSDALIEDIKLADNIDSLKIAFMKAYKYGVSFNRCDVVQKATSLKDLRKKELKSEKEAQVEKLFNIERDSIILKLRDIGSCSDFDTAISLIRSLQKTLSEKLKHNKVLSVQQKSELKALLNEKEREIYIKKGKGV